MKKGARSSFNFQHCIFNQSNWKFVDFKITCRIYALLANCTETSYGKLLSDFLGRRSHANTSVKTQNVFTVDNTREQH